MNTSLYTRELKRHHIYLKKWKYRYPSTRYGEMNVLRLFNLGKQGNIICKQIFGIDLRDLSLCTRTLDLFVLGLQKGR